MFVEAWRAQKRKGATCYVKLGTDALLLQPWALAHTDCDRETTMKRYERQSEKMYEIVGHESQSIDNN